MLPGSAPARARENPGCGIASFCRLLSRVEVRGDGGERATHRPPIGRQRHGGSMTLHLDLEVLLDLVDEVVQDRGTQNTRAPGVRALRKRRGAPLVPRPGEAAGAARIGEVA